LEGALKINFHKHAFETKKRKYDLNDFEKSRQKKMKTGLVY
jgi:hypothetical protein